MAQASDSHGIAVSCFETAGCRENVITSAESRAMCPSALRRRDDPTDRRPAHLPRPAGVRTSSARGTELGQPARPPLGRRGVRACSHRDDACGLPVIACAAHGPAEIVRDGPRLWAGAEPDRPELRLVVVNEARRHARTPATTSLRRRRNLPRARRHVTCVGLDSLARRTAPKRRGERRPQRIGQRICRRDEPKLSVHLGDGPA